MFERRNTGRVFIVNALFYIALFIVVGRLFMVQVVKASYYRQRATSQYEKSVVLRPQRGEIYDRNGRKLAFNKRSDWIYSLSYQIHDDSLNVIDEFLCEVFEKPIGTYRDKIRSRFGYVVLEKNVELEIVDRIKKREIFGIYNEEGYRRVYPYGSCGAQVIGHTNIDNVGLEGLELYYNEVLCGRFGRAVMFSDGHGNKNPMLIYRYENPN
jgi:cell division protein FtsI/penicillin-binding protein 2